jgi:RNA-directed DNA polymerase
VVLWPKGHAQKTMLEIRRFLARLRLTVNEEKTRITTAREGFDFLGVHFRERPSRRLWVGSVWLGPRAGR